MRHATELREELRHELGAHDQLLRQNGEASDPVSESEMAQWVAWASTQAEQIDPVLSKSSVQMPEDSGPASRAVVQAHGQSPSEAAGAASEQAWHPHRWYTRVHR
jgi:hypothetical protein